MAITSDSCSLTKGENWRLILEAETDVSGVTEALRGETKIAIEHLTKVAMTALFNGFKEKDWIQKPAVLIAGFKIEFPPITVKLSGVKITLKAEIVAPTKDEVIDLARQIHEQFTFFKTTMFTWLPGTLLDIEEVVEEEAQLAEHAEAAVKNRLAPLPEDEVL